MFYFAGVLISNYKQSKKFPNPNQTSHNTRVTQICLPRDILNSFNIIVKSALRQVAAKDNFCGERFCVVNPTNWGVLDQNKECVMQMHRGCYVSFHPISMQQDTANYRLAAR